MKTELAEDKLGGLTCSWRFDFSRSSRDSPYLSSEDTGMYPSSASIRQTAQALSLNSQYIPPPYDFPSYHHHVTGVGDLSASTWNPLYAPREEYPYSFPGSSPNTAQVNFTYPDLSNVPSAAGGGSLTPYNFISGQDPLIPRKRPQEPVKQTTSGGKTRTKDKYRVVYTDHQRMELEKEFQFNRYITMRRKSELSMALSLSERQVKIWFQNRRAKERKINRKKLQHSQQASTTTPTPPVLCAHSDTHNPVSPSRNILSDAVSEEY
ncbi:homeobox protein CDX-1-like [Astatotilapia calliptera]|uniref:Homeobox domain-containing protein n=2 Tax=Haplochromini TaxID=319058 RepID=A0AAX7VJH6_ASTCA|nr:homeobox protein CDX-1 [Haplochromis burtoni]XP_026036073.1 homeobox protein CDX-1-like [Astatotilapia calliptera]